MNAFASFTTRALRLRSLRIERRLHRRAATYWQTSRKGASIPLLANFDFACDEEFSSRGFLLNVEHARPVLIHVGEILMDEAGLSSPTIALEVVPAETLLGRFGRRYSQAIDARAPVTTEHVFDTSAGYRISCRAALLPFSATGDSIDYVYGVISWKSELIAHSEDPALAISVHQ